MRLLAFAAFACVFGAVALGSLGGCKEVADALGVGADSGAAASSDASASTDAGIVGGNCGTESNTGTTLCQAVSTCPSTVVDTQSMPHCGFRIRGALVDLVCGCGTSLCPMGTFATCDEAAQLLAKQTEQGVCVQLAEDRCTEVTSPSPSSTTTTATPPPAANPACDKECMQQCGGGSACASVCNCG